MDDWTKPAIFAGVFYPGNARDLKSVLREFEAVAEKEVPEPAGNIVGVVSPHAGYIYSGGTAARSYYFARREKPDTVIAIGLSHRVRLQGISILDAAECETPLGPLHCDREFRDKLSAQVPFAETNREAHLSEHSVETQLPFIRFYFPNAKIVEILTQDFTPPLPEHLGEAIAETARELKRSVLIVSSTDLSHYPSGDLAEKIDADSLEALKLLDPVETNARIAEIEGKDLPEVRCAVCSKAAVLAGMGAAKSLGAGEGIALGYAHSGQAELGDRDRVVGYGSLAWVRNP